MAFRRLYCFALFGGVCAIDFGAGQVILWCLLYFGCFKQAKVMDFNSSLSG
jgi:hypothetical protein